MISTSKFIKLYQRRHSQPIFGPTFTMLHQPDRLLHISSSLLRRIVPPSPDSGASSSTTSLAQPQHTIPPSTESLIRVAATKPRLYAVRSFTTSSQRQITHHDPKDAQKNNAFDYEPRVGCGTCFKSQIGRTFRRYKCSIYFDCTLSSQLFPPHPPSFFTLLARPQPKFIFYPRLLCV